MTSLNTVKKKVRTAEGAIHITLIGKHYTLGEGIAAIQVRLEAKKELKECKNAQHYLDAALASISKHDISRSKGNIMESYAHIVTGLQNGHKALFNSYLLLMEMLRNIHKFEKQHNDRANTKAIAQAKNKIARLLHQQLANANAVYAKMNGRTGIAMIGKEALTSDNYVTMYMRMRREIRAAFKDEKRMEAFLKDKKIDENFDVRLAKFMDDEFDKLGKLMKDILFKMGTLVTVMDNIAVNVNKAVSVHELPAAFNTDEAFAHNAVRKLVHAQEEALHTFINNIYGTAKKI